MKVIKNTGKVLAVFAAAALFFTGCASSKVSSGAEQKLVILHTNDHHGSVLSRKDKEGIGQGGLAERATFIKMQRAEAQKTGSDILVLDAGDVNTGMAVSNMFAAEPDIMAYNAMGYDAVALGNHEFDGTLEKLLKQIKISKFPWLSANIKQGKNYLVKPYIIKNFNGLKVGIFGLTTLRTKVIASPDKSLTFYDEINTAKEMVSLLRDKKKADIVILVGHLGDVLETSDQETSVRVAEAVSGIDLIVDGHSHSYFAEPKYVGGTPIVTSNEWGKYMGKAVFTVKDKKITKLEWTPVKINDKDFPPDAEMVALLKPYVERANASLKEVVMKTTAEFEFGRKWPRYKEMASGDLLCDATVGYVKSTGVDVDFAIHNGGNIRTSLPKGDVTKENIVTMLPFENYVYVLTLKGADVKALFNFIQTQNQGAGGFPQVSKEVRYTLTYDSDGTNGRISDITIGGKPIDNNKLYRIATNDYMAGGGDGYVVMKNSVDTYNTSMLVNDVFIEYVKSLPQPVTPATDGRIKIVGGAPLP
ncbi:5'-nucleotidase C-terminal domain-containing protein [Treponema parvum]|uniref:5'-nucleotidase C-terminal domain-containing protein n=1 Tax=Treponema parvum TaxID=138851 RepID=A0A975EXU7_9SPIR|nr:5'-nucleotidase C-terminal domain-containing protein [Treponema parvum]QTQ10777.1 5'-nucleotidase C-terminal domain-containing protein [Treponema parvum]QTQ17261.1 5'-nucleotidase C-terminal domain-containing protein [Treponema parvum]